MSIIYNLVDIFLMNSNEKDIFEIIKDTKNKVIFDVGSFQGKFTEKLIRLENKKSKSKYYLFDPNPNGQKYIKRLIQKHKNIFFSCVGLHNKIETKTFYLNNFFEASGSSFQKILKNDKLWNLSRKMIVSLSEIFSVKSEKNFKQLRIKTNTIDNFCQSKKIKKIDVLKIDAEGHEEFILRGSLNMLRRNQVKSIYVEVLANKDNFNFKKNKIKNLLKRFQFKCIKEYPIRSVSVLSDLKCSDFFFINKKYKSESK